MEKKYWKSLEELKSGSGKDYLEDHEYVNKGEMLDLIQGDSLRLSSNRRDFLKLFGYGLATTALVAGCKRPIQKAIPYLFKPEEVTPGLANYYASTFFDGDDYGSVLVKVRDGRPIKIEGNDLSPISKGGATARIQSSVLELYDNARYRYPQANGSETSWEEVDRRIIAGLQEAAGSSGKIVVLTGTVISPSTREILEAFLTSHPRSEWVQYDPLSFSAMLDANGRCFNKRVVPSIHFDKAKLIVSFGADFLGSWLMPGTFARQYAEGRRLTEGQADMSKHIHFESGLSLTGSNADERITVKPSQINDILTYLLAKLQGRTSEVTTGFDSRLDALTVHLKENAGKSIVVCGYNDVRMQGIVNGINHLLGNYGNTLDISRPVNIRQGSDMAMHTLVDEMKKGEVSALILHNGNPVFDYPDGEGFAEGLKKVALKASLTGALDETSSLCDYICPDSHYLESWGDAEPISGHYSLQQPVIHPLGSTRQMQESILRWSGKESDYHSYLKSYWERVIYPSSNFSGDFNSFWNDCLQKGVLELQSTMESQPSFIMANLYELLNAGEEAKSIDGIFELEICQSLAIGSGKHANNPWLQELPDPVSKLSWDNFLAISEVDAATWSLETGDIVILNDAINIPVLIQPGQTPGTVSAAMGYGRKVAGKVAEGVGVNVISLAGFKNSCITYNSTVTSLEKTEKKHKMALSQTHHTMEGRDLVRETTLPQYLENPASGNEMREGILKHMYTLYEKVTFEGLHWAMAIDLNACTGCSSCVIACQAENNIPVIGKEEIFRRRIMHWMRIDRYYSGDSNNLGVHFMPVMCQHCDNAPCENVCPVAATNHSDEGINQMAYVRCIGTKYCINNCPYKVRRFNWFNYTKSDDYNSYMNDETGRLVLNPDVTIRDRGIVEKCSFCIQRIQEAKIRAKAENRVLREDEVVPACVQTCPSKAIVFGNIADENSPVSKLFRDKRNYHLLEELHTLPSVGYLTRVKNKQS